MYCVVRGCKSVWNPSSDIKFHRFPFDTTRKYKWLSVIPIKGKFYKSAKICSQHFKPVDYDPERPGYLLKTAVPNYSTNICECTITTNASTGLTIENRIAASVCHGCLSKDRMMTPVKDLQECLQEAAMEDVFQEQARLCWECIAILRKFSDFRSQVKNVQGVIALMTKMNSFEALTNLGVTVKKNYDFCYTHGDVSHVDNVKLLVRMKEEFAEFVDETFEIGDKANVNRGDGIADSNEDDNSVDYADPLDEINDTEDPLLTEVMHVKVEPADPMVVADPTDATDPTDTIDPTDAIDPTEAIDPNDPDAASTSTQQTRSTRGKKRKLDTKPKTGNRLSAAEKTKRYREQMKRTDPVRYTQMLQKNREQSLKNYYKRKKTAKHEPSGQENKLRARCRAANKKKKKKEYSSYEKTCIEIVFVS